MATPPTFVFDPRISSAVRASELPAAPPAPAPGPLAPDLLERMQQYWQAANYLTIGQIYLQENPLLREPLQMEHLKPRLLGHWGTSPGLNFIYVHLNRLIRDQDVDAIYLAGPGHGGPALVANVYLEGTYSEIYPEISQDTAGLRRLFRQFSTPGGIPSHVSVTTPGSIHEGGELGYVLTHAFGAAFDNPDLLVVAVVGDGEAETGPLAGSWKGVSFLNPTRDGAVLPILHLNGYKIANPTVLGRARDDEVQALLESQGYAVHFVEGDDPPAVHQQFAATLDTCYATIREIQSSARTRGFSGQPRWPAIVLRTPKGWTGPKELNGLPVEGTFRAHQVPLPDAKTDPAQLAMLETWLRSYQPEDLFDLSGRLDGGESAREWGEAAGAAVTARFSVLHPAGGPAGGGAPRVDPPAGDLAAGRLPAERRQRQLPPLLPGRGQLEPPGERLRGREPRLRRDPHRPRRSRTAGWAGV
jgi:xylulose-5-phosphate/fructose-6-phosphate phosphoketolase